MKDNRLKEEFLSVEVPDLKTKIMAAVHGENRVRPRRRLRPAVVMAAMLILFGLTAGAVTGGMLNLKNGSKYYFMDENGNTVRPIGFHLEEDVAVPLSGKALANITPYVHLPVTDEEIRFYETAIPEAMEEFLDMPLYLPESVKAEASRYRMMAYGTDGTAVTIYVQVQTEENPDAVRIYLRGSPGVIVTDSVPEMEEYALSDGTPVSIAVAKQKEGGLAAHALYRRNDAVYHLRMAAGGKRELLENMKAVLDTVK